MTRLVVKDKHKIDTRDNEIGLHSQNKCIILSSIINTNMLVWSLKEKEESSIWHRDSNVDTWNDNLHDPQLLISWINLQTYPMVKIACGIGCVYYKPAYYALSHDAHLNFIIG